MPKNNIRRKAQLGLDIREGGIAIPIAPNMYYMNGRSHNEGGIGIGPNNKNGLEVEGGEVVKVGDRDIKVFSSVPLLRGVSPAQLVLQGYNPNDVFKAQEEFKDRNRLNDDGTHYQTGGNKIININDLPSSFKGQYRNGKYLQIGIPPIANKANKLDVNFKQRMSALNDDVKDFIMDGIKYVNNILPKPLRKYYARGINILNSPGVEGINNAGQKITQVQSIIDEKKAGGIYIKPSKRGTFTAAAKKRGMGVQEFASKVLANKEDYSSAMVKKANFARNASRWKKELGGEDDTKTAALKRLRNRFAVNSNYNTNENILPEVIADKESKTFFEKVDDYADIAEKTLAIPNMALSGYSLIAPNPYTAVGAYLTGLANGGIDIYQGIRSAIKGDWFNAGKNAIDLGMSLVGLRALRNANKLNALDKSLDASGAPREYVTKMVGRGRGRTRATFTKEKNEAIKEAAVGYGMIPSSAAMSLLDTNKSRNKKEFGGNMIYEINGNVRNGLMSARPKAKLGKTVKINRGSYETVDEAVERYKQLYRIRYGKEPAKNDIERVAWTKSLENAVNGNPNLITGYGPNIGVRGPNVTKIVFNANKGRQIARTQTAIRNKNVKSTSPKRQAVNTKVSEAARLERQSQFDAWQQGEAFKASTMPTDAVAVNRPTIGAGVRSGRRGRVDDVVAIERSQRGVDPLSSKPKFGVYDKAYAKKVNGKMNQFANVLLGSGTGAVIVGNTLYDKEQSNEEQANLDNNLSNDNPVNSNIKIQSDSSSTIKVNNKPTVNKNTNNTYVSTTKPNTGESYIINPLTGEWIRNGVTETSEPSVKGTNKVSSRASSAPRRGETKATSSKPTSKSTPTLRDNINQITRDAISRSIAPKIDLSKVEMPTFDVSQLGSKETKAAKAKLNTSSTGGSTKPKDGRWVGQYKPITTGDWIGLGSNVLGSLASYFITKNAINKMPDPVKPIMAPAAKLKTRYNIEPQLTNVSEAEQMNRASVRRNTQSSNTSLAREQRLMNEARGTRNQLYGQKENIETQLINQDRLNRQSVMRDNVRTYNDYLNRLTATRQNQNQLRVSNINNLISGLTGSVNNILSTIDTRRATNNTLRAIAAANPNVDARLIGGFDYYIDPITKRKYNKNQQYVGTINS